MPSPRPLGRRRSFSICATIERPFLQTVFSVPSPKSLWFRRRSVGCFSRRERSAQIRTDTGRASNAEKQPTGRGPEGCVENGPAAALLVGYVSIQICALLTPVRLGPPCRRPILNATICQIHVRRCTSRLRPASERLASAQPPAPDPTV